MLISKHSSLAFIITLTILAVSLTGIVLYFTFSTLLSTQNASCKDNDGVVFCISPTNNPMIINAKITNNSSDSYTAKFTTTCTTPNLIINGEPQGGTMLCGQAPTNVVLNSGKSTTYQLHIPSDLSNKTVRVSAEWEELSSGELQLQLP